MHHITAQCMTFEKERHKMNAKNSMFDTTFQYTSKMILIYFCIFVLPHHNLHPSSLICHGYKNVNFIFIILFISNIFCAVLFQLHILPIYSVQNLRRYFSISYKMFLLFMCHFLILFLVLFDIG